MSDRKRTPDITPLVRRDLAAQFGEEIADQLMAKLDEIMDDLGIDTVDHCARPQR